MQRTAPSPEHSQLPLGPRLPIQMLPPLYATPQPYQPVPPIPLGQPSNSNLFADATFPASGTSYADFQHSAPAASNDSVVDIEQQYQISAQQIRDLLGVRLSLNCSDNADLLLQRFEGAADLIAGTLMQELLQSPDLQVRRDLLQQKLDEAMHRLRNPSYTQLLHGNTVPQLPQQQQQQQQQQFTRGRSQSPTVRGRSQSPQKENTRYERKSTEELPRAPISALQELAEQRKQREEALSRWVSTHETDYVPQRDGARRQQRWNRGDVRELDLSNFDYQRGSAAAVTGSTESLFEQRERPPPRY
eukprot:TRINITY_DN2098_c0_g1_i1.p1 TRINITY_DN2098_c0_g1~~TRINITY_DN2098_c0_g1_i1.p1  ORF type:complete len:303 (-),score=69.34 TRINITY_DN2098_c0_g1_i1:19-927(-)